MTPRPPQSRDDQDMIICPIDKQRVKGHARCARCTILIGPGHYAREGYTTGEGLLLCQECVQRAAKKQRAELAADR